MQLWDLIVEQAVELTAVFKYPSYLWWIPVLFVILLILITRTFVRYAMDEADKRKLKRMRIFTFSMRFIALSLLVIALATPFTELTTESAGNPRAVILVDRSGSMENYDTSFLPILQRGISAQLPTTMKEFGSETQSPVGDALLGQDAHVLIISDGNANTGVQLRDVAQVAQENNLSINMITLSPLKDDAAVYVSAPSDVPLGYPAKIVVEVTSTQQRPVPLSVLIDGKEVHNAPTLGAIELSPDLGTGYHRIEARIAGGDANPANDAYYRVMQVLEKPKVLVISGERGPLENALAGLFDVTVTQSVPSQLDDYYVVVINDESRSHVRDVPRIAEFLRDEQGGKYGGGLVVLGGFNSFDRGDYQRSELETLLPVKVGKAKRSLGENNIVIVMQVSGSTGGTRIEIGPDGQRREVVDTEPTIDIIKAQAVSAINSLNLRNNVGVVAFGVSTTGLDASSAQETLQASVVKIADVKPLYSHKQELVDKIPRIQGGGTTAPDIALKTAVDMLKDKSGDKTIILLTNGRFSAGLGSGESVPAKANTLAVVENAYKRYNIKTQTLGVGSADDALFAKKVDEAFLKTVATRGDSTYDRATNMASLIVKYGDPDEKGFGEDFMLVPLSLTHFITRDLELDAVLNGFNEVVPKDGSRMLVSTDAGDPAVTIWNYFNGRVAAVTVFTGGGVGPLLQGKNSDLLRNTVLWAVGDPTRKQAVRTIVEPALVGEKAEITFISDQPISGSCPDTELAFDRSSGDTYIFTFTPTKTGFSTACGIPYAVNGPSEVWKVGTAQELKDAVAVSGGAAFSFDQVEEIVEQIRTVSTRVTTEKTEIRNPFIALAILLFLVEIFVRRMSQKT
jgi:uncharacterized membrane protein